MAVLRLAVLITVALVAAACTDDRRPVAAEASSSVAVTSASTTTSTTTTTVPPASDALQAVVDEFVEGQTVRFSVVAIDLTTGVHAEHLGDRQVRSASLYKLFVARELLRRIYAGTLQRDAAAGDGEGRTIDQCIHDMIVVSDNACGAAGLSIVGQGAQDAALHRAGFVKTSLAAPQMTSAADVALFFTRARDGSLLGEGGEAASAELYALLRQQAVNDRLPTGLPTGTPIAHKTGDIRGWAHDAGVITTPRGDVVLAVLSGPWPYPCCDADHPGAAERVAFGAIAELGRQVYEVLA